MTVYPKQQVDGLLFCEKEVNHDQLIAAAHGILFALNLPEQFIVTIPVGQFSKAVSNILANAVAYTGAGKTVASLIFL